jgi:hypothetical protein
VLQILLFYVDFLQNLDDAMRKAKTMARLRKAF